MTTDPSTLTENPYAGSGQHSHEVPLLVGHVVEIRDGGHEGTAIWRRDDDEKTFCFVSFDVDTIIFSKRCVLVRGQDVQHLNDPFGCCLESPDGLVLVGVEEDENLSWLSDGSEVLWDSSKEYEIEIDDNGTPRIGQVTSRASFDYVVRVQESSRSIGDESYRALGAEWGLMPDDGDDLRVLMVPDGTTIETLDAIETLLDDDPSVVRWCPLVDPGEPLDKEAWKTAIAIVR